MLYPLIASSGNLFGEWGLVWGLLIVNVIAVALGTWVIAKVALELGISAWYGLAFTLNPGVLYEVSLDGAGVVAWALAAAGILAVMKGREGVAVLVFTAAVLTREVMLVVPVGILAYQWRREDTRPLRLVTVPAVVAILWGGWVRFRLGVPLTTLEGEEIGLPLVGIARGVRQWFINPDISVVVGLVSLAFVVIALHQAVWARSLVIGSTLGFAILAFFLTGRVWFYQTDSSRAVAPLFTTVVLVAAARCVSTSSVDP
jgi:hypothetical protein